MPYYRNRKVYNVNSFKFNCLDTITPKPIDLSTNQEAPSNPFRFYWINENNQFVSHQILEPVKYQCLLVGLAGCLDFSVVNNKTKTPISVGYSIVIVNSEQIGNVKQEGTYNKWGKIGIQVYTKTESLLCYGQGLITSEINMKSIEFSPETKRKLNEKDTLILTIYSSNVTDEDKKSGSMDTKKDSNSGTVMVSGSLRFFIKTSTR